MDAEMPSLPIGRSGRLRAASVANTTGNHAIIVQQDDAPRALLTGEAPRPQESRERLVVTPLDDDVDIRVDGDALSVWLAQGSVGRAAEGSVPAWANAIGFALVLLVVLFLVIGSVTFFAWLFAALGLAR